MKLTWRQPFLFTSNLIWKTETMVTKKAYLTLFIARKSRITLKEDGCLLDFMAAVGRNCHWQGKAVFTHRAPSLELMGDTDLDSWKEYICVLHLQFYLLFHLLTIRSKKQTGEILPWRWYALAGSSPCNSHSQCRNHRGGWTKPAARQTAKEERSK